MNYNTFWDNLNLDYLDEKNKIKVKKVVNKAWCLKRLVSKKKRRFENEQFDLDMAYVTKRVIAMGYPATGFESVYRNSVDEVTRFFHYYHNDNVKIYNLCIEKDRIYDRNQFNKSNVGLFPAKDHNPCPIKLILEFCVDICLYLIKNPEGVSAVHCKAGKGRTGVMICSYLIFSGLCKTSEDAFAHYAASRTYNKKGVTIPSQKRYIQYFESFLETNFCPPYIFLIPKIVKYHLNMNTTNILRNFMNDKSYFISPNGFILKYIKVGPLPSQSNFSVKICDFIVQSLKFETIKKSHDQININGKKYYYMKFEFDDLIKIDSDIKISIKGGGLDFYIWANLWYSTLNLIKSHLDSFHRDLIHDHKVKNNNNHELMSKLTSSAKTVKQEERVIVNDKVSEREKLNKKALQYNNLSSNEDEDEEEEEKEKEKERKLDKQIKPNFKSPEENNTPNTNTNINEHNPNQIESNNNNFISEPNEADNLFDIIYKLKHNTDLNLLIKTINKILVNEGKQPFDKSDLSISLGASELDKFSKSKSMNKNFTVNIGFSLFE